MIVTFCLPQFTAKRLRLQPWLTVHRVAMGLLDRGHEVHIVTDEDEPEQINGIFIHRVKSLRGTNSRQIISLLQSIRPDSVIVSVSPLSLATAGWHRKLNPFKTLAYLSCPVYSVKQIVKAFPHLSWKERWEYGRQVFVPRHLWIERLVRLFDGVICQSRRTGREISIQTRSRIPVHVIQPGIDRELWSSLGSTKQDGSRTSFLYLGAASGIRGFFVVLDAFTLISDSEIKLKILARGADEREVKEIEAAVLRRHIQDRVLIKGGWLELSDLKKEIQSAAAVLLPFVLVPSELPVTVMESIYCGTPVVVSDIDGLPDAAGNAGVVVSPGNPSILASAILKLHQQKEYLFELNAACIRQRKNMLSWNSVYDRWFKVLAG